MSRWLPGTLLLLAGPLFAADAEIVFLQGSGEKSAGSERAAWQPAAQGDTIAAGIWVRTLANSQMGLTVPDRNQVRLKPNSELQLNTAEQKQAFTQARLKLTKGGAWSKATPRPASGANAPRAKLQMETAAASLSIRGTDWQVDVAEDGSMQVVVLSGEVEVANEQGQLAVGAGEAARAEPGKAPVKLTLVNPASRVQWVSSWQPEPRRWGDAQPGSLAGEIARIERGDYAAALAALQPRAAAEPQAARLAADLLLHEGRVEDAVALLAPHAVHDPRAAALRARALVRLDRLEEAELQLREAPVEGEGATEVWLARGELAVLRGDAETARAAFTAAAGTAGDARSGAEADYGLGLIASEREQVRVARRALERALAADPGLGKAAAERAAVETFAGNLLAAATQYDVLLAEEGANYLALTGRGINRLKQGDPDAALADFMKAGLIEPRYARAWLYQGVAFYQLGETGRALQAFARAEELDARDPVPHMLRSQVAADALDFDEAIVEARAAQSNMPYLRSLNQLASDQKGSANLGSPIAGAALEEWAGFYADQAYSPYWGGSHLFQADRYSGKFLKNSELMKGFLTDPLAFGAPTRFSALVQRPGHYQRLDAGYLRDQGYNEAIVRATASGLVTMPQQAAYFVQGEYQPADAYENATTGDTRALTAGLGWRPRHDLGLFLFGVDSQRQADIEIPLENAQDTETLPDDDLEQDEQRLDGGLNFKWGPQNQLWIKSGYGSQRNEVDGVLYSEDSAAAFEQFIPSFFNGRVGARGALGRNDTRIFGNDFQLRHAFTIGAADWAWGMEFAEQEQRVDFAADFPAAWSYAAFDPTATRLHTRTRLYQREEFSIDDELAYLNVRLSMREDLQLEAGVFAQDSREDRSDRLVFRAFRKTELPLETGESHSANFNPRLGLRWDLRDRQQLRLVAQRWRRPASFGSLAPMDTLGIALDDRLPSAGGKYDRLRLQYDAELTPALFVEAFADREVIDNDLAGQRTAFFSFQVEQLGKLRTREEFFTAPDLYEETPIFPEGSVSTLGLAANTLLGDGATLYTRYLYRYGENRSDDLDYDGEIPYVPHHYAELGGQLELMPRWLLRIEAVYRSKRFQNDADLYEPARSGVAFRVKSYWETADKHHSLQLVLDHLALDQDAMIHEQRHELVHLQYGYRF